MSRPILSRPRTFIYGSNYDKGESYYKPMVDHLDRKYSARPLFPEPRNSIADEIAARRNDIGNLFSRFPKWFWRSAAKRLPRPSSRNCRRGLLNRSVRKSNTWRKLLSRLPLLRPVPWLAWSILRRSSSVNYDNSALASYTKHYSWKFMYWMIKRGGWNLEELWEILERDCSKRNQLIQWISSIEHLAISFRYSRN